MAAMAAELVSIVGKECIIVLDAYFAVGPVFSILGQVLDDSGHRLLHLVTRAKRNVVGYQDPPPKTGRPGRPRQYGAKLKLMDLFETMGESFEKVLVEIYGQSEEVSFLCLDLIWRPIKEKVRFVLVRDGSNYFILMSSDLTLSAHDIICAYSYRFKIEVSFKVLKHLIGAFFYRFWTSAWPRIGKRNVSDLSTVGDSRSRRLIRQATNAIEAFVNFACIATGLLQIVSLNFHETIWKRYLGWLRTMTSAVPSEEVVKSVIQEEYYHNFRSFSNSAIYRIIMSKNRKRRADELPMAA
ncbi:MAG: transposase [Methanotrichaceae archaeon]